MVIPKIKIIINKAKDPIDKKAKDITIVGIEFVPTLLPLLFPIYVRVSRKEAITTAKVMAPFTSRLCVTLVLPLVSTPSWFWEGALPSFSTISALILSLPSMNLLIITKRMIATGTIERK